MKLRPSSAVIIAVLALVVAMAGTSYAAGQIGSSQIKNNSVKGKDVKDGNLTGKDVRDGTLAGADVADNGLTGADIADGSLTRADTDHTCPATSVPVMGACIDKLATGPTGYFPSLQDCDGRGG